MAAMTFWTKQELSVLHKYGWRHGLAPLYSRIHDINPARTFEAVARKLRELRGLGLIKFNPRVVAYNSLRVGYFDIESSDLNADKGYMLSWAIKEAGVNNFYGSCLTKNDIIIEKFDYNLLIKLIDVLNKFDMIVTYYGSRFDIPFLKARIAEHNLEQIPWGTKFQCDLYFVVKSHLKITRKSLDNVTKLYDLQTSKIHKTSVDIKLWRLASIGNAKALQSVYAHNRADVILLEKLHNKLKPLYRQDIFRSI